MLATIRDAVAAIRDTLVERGEDSPFGRYTVRGGNLTATDRELAASTPVLLQGEFSVGAKALEKALAAMPGDVNVTHVVDAEGRGALTLRHGRARVTIETLPPDHDAVEPAPMLPATAGLLLDLKALLPLVSDDASVPWMNAVVSRGGRLFAVAPGAKVVAWTHGDHGTWLLSRRAVEVVVKRNQPFSFGASETGVAFAWSDGTMLRASQVAGTVPDIIDRKADSWVEPTWRVTPEWRAAWRRVAALADGQVSVDGERVSARAGRVEAEDFADCPLGHETAWSPRDAGAVLEQAELIDLGGSPAPFRYGQVRGFVSGLAV